MVILRTRNKITDFLMILAWASPFNVGPLSVTLVQHYPIPYACNVSRPMGCRGWCHIPGDMQNTPRSRTRFHVG